MDNTIYDYNRWLSTHAKSKSMMEKLERSLIPYELFALIGMTNDFQSRFGIVTLNDNTYRYEIVYDYHCYGNDVYNATIECIAVRNRWHDILLGYNRFKIVMHQEQIKTIYSDHEDYFYRVIDMFENGDTSALLAHRSAYINNLLARYILLRIIEKHCPKLQLLTVVDTASHGDVHVMAASANRRSIVMYAFSKREAIEMASNFDGICPDLSVVYFFNQDFQHYGNDFTYSSDTTKVLSIRDFYIGLTSDSVERCELERRVFSLISLLYNERIKWDNERVERVIADPEGAIVSLKSHPKPKHRKDKKKDAKESVVNVTPWWNKIPRTLLEDALNVLGDTPSTHSDVFHFLCAANMVNAYINHCKSKRTFGHHQMARMYQAKTQIMERITAMAKERNQNVTIAVNDLPAIYVEITVKKRHYQFSFRGVDIAEVEQLVGLGVAIDGEYQGQHLQQIAAALYQYSYLLRWRGL